MHFVAVLVFAFVLGTVVGSFLNVAALRSLKSESVVWPPSHCPLCNHRLAAKDLVPVLSYVLLGGKCRYCLGSISPQYPLVEAAAGLIFAVLAWKYGLTWKFSWLATFASVLIIATITDLKEMVVPLEPIAIGLAAVTFLKVAAGVFKLSDILTALACSALLALPAGFGLTGDGDAPVAALIGLTLGPVRTVEALFWAVVFGGTYGIALLVKDSQNRKKQVPLVPFLAAGSAVAVFVPGTLAVLAWL